MTILALHSAWRHAIYRRRFVYRFVTCGRRRRKGHGYLLVRILDWRHGALERVPFTASPDVSRRCKPLARENPTST